ncbi:MAG TPA: AbrB/MazE/SpoVT family DNA-binding domain-containing protein [Rhodanobacteraceae bacterium]|nr:AbrB/MazE/SpoVT family DNA-binding domain-containing protein [Rhodanobacteraceae bacterium]
MTLKVTKIGNSLGVVLPKEALARLKVEQGGSLFLTELPDGYRVIAFDETIVEQVNEGRDFMREFRETFRALAK